MGIFHGLNKAFSSSSSGSVDIDQLMAAAEAPITAEEKAGTPADSYVKPITLKSELDLHTVQEELGKKNIVLLNVSALTRNPQKLKETVAKIRAFVTSINGDIARIDDEKILITPAAVKIVKKRKA